ncbi:hypothetical protein [Mycolicibacterium cosmeticum]|uniref:hypothetical protein n=1 Tax=Mycolicibacterium cosmeticum TaxID=258533 RepID=UPI0032046439
MDDQAEAEALKVQLRTLADEFVDALNRNDRRRLGELTTGQANYDLEFTSSSLSQDHQVAPYVYRMQAGIKWDGPVKIRTFDVQARGDMLTVVSMYSPFEKTSDREIIPGAFVDVVFKMVDGSWKISSIT